jgi:glycosyltransferase involved in cell wall biosynthesis
MRQRGYRSIPVIRGPGWVRDSLLKRGLEPVVFDAKGSMNLSYLWRLIALIRRERVALIQSHLLGSNVYCALAGWITHTPVVGTFHGMVDVSPGERLRWLKRVVMGLGIDVCVLVSLNLRDAISAAGFVGLGNTRVIYNGIDMRKYERQPQGRFRAELGLGASAKLAVSIGNIRPAKGYDVLIRAASLLLPRHPDLHFVIAGHVKNDLMRELTSLMVELGVQERMHFLGFVRNTAALLSEADVFVLSSTSEGFSLSTVEALACAVPAVLTRCGGPEEIATHGEHALMVAPGDSSALAGAIDTALNDPELAGRLGQQGRKMARERFSIEVMLDSYEVAYRSLGVGERP